MALFRQSGMISTGGPPPVRRHIGSAADHVYNYRQLGQLFMMGFDGTSVNPQIRALIEDHRVGSVLLTAKNLKCAFDIRTTDEDLLTNVLYSC